MDPEPTYPASAGPTKVTTTEDGATQVITGTKAARTPTTGLDKPDAKDENVNKRQFTDKNIQDQANDDAEPSRHCKDYYIRSIPHLSQDDGTHDTPADTESSQNKILQRLSVNIESLKDLLKLARVPFDRGDDVDYLREAVGFGSDLRAVIRYQLALLVHDLKLPPRLAQLGHRNPISPAVSRIPTHRLCGQHKNEMQTTSVLQSQTQDYG